MLGFLLFSVYCNIIEGMGMIKLVFYISLIGLVVNVFVNYVFIYGKLGFDVYGGVGCGIVIVFVFIFMVLI